MDPTSVDDRFVQVNHAGKAPTDPDTQVSGTSSGGSRSIGTACLRYAFIWLFGWTSWGIQYVVKLVGDILLTAGWSLSPDLPLVSHAASDGWRGPEVQSVGLIALYAGPSGG
jgi:type IV secretion system protein TrbL